MVQSVFQYICTFKEASSTIPWARKIVQLQHNLSASKGELPMNVSNELNKF